MSKTRRIDYSLNFSVEVPNDVPANNVVAHGDFVVEDVDGSGFVVKIAAEEHTLESWGEKED